jgi:TolA-binding protein
MKSLLRLLAASLVVSVLFPCAVDTSPRFVPRRIPEKFDTAFLRGELGIVPSTLSAKYKLIAWRYLAGLPLDRDEQESMMLHPAQLGDSSPAPMELWRKARNSLGAPRPQFFYLITEKSSRVDQGTYYNNCLDGAFTSAASTLADRQKQYANVDALKAWVAAQDLVFQNCSSDKPVYPEEPGSGMTPLARADRDYQIAAAHFYAEDLEGAEQRFRAIAADTNSPWRETSAYMVARTLIREGLLLHKADAFAAAKAELQKIAAGPLFDSAQGLIAYTDTLTDPSTKLKELAGKLAVPHPGPAISGPFEESVYVLTGSRFHDALTQPDVPEPFDWIEALGADRNGHSVEHWRQTQSALWLVAALIHAENGDEANADLMDAALKVAETSPAFDTVTFHTIRLMIGAGRNDEARRTLNALLGGKRHLLDSVDNAYREQRMSLATSFDDLLRWAPRRPIGISEEFEGYGSIDGSPILGYDGLKALNDFTPLEKLIAAAASNRLPDGSRAQIANSAWTRAFLLADDASADNLAPLLEKSHAAWAADLEAFRGASGDAKRFAGALLIERHADFHPAVWLAFAPNWWCAEPFPGKADATIPDAALSQKERTLAQQQVQGIRKAGAAQAFLAPIVMSWAKAHPDDPRVPEALHRLVRVTRYGCYGVAGNGAISKAAFDLLHQRYPDNKWTRDTPYWFNQ